MATDPGAGQQGGLLGQIRHYWHILVNWKWTILFIFFTAVAAAAVYSFTATPVFTSSGSIWIEDDANILPFEEVQTFGPATSLLSHTQLLRSRTLAADTIEKLKLYDNLDFAGKPKKEDKPRDPADPIYRETLVHLLLSNISVSEIERTRLVNVSYSSQDPRLAAEILNALFDGYIDMIIRQRYSASERASEFLNTQIAELRVQIEEKERELNRYGSEKNILPLTASEVPTVSRISEVNSALTAARLEKINKLNYYAQLKAAPLGEIPDAPQGSLIQRLKEQYFTLSRQYATRLATVKPEYPEMQKLKSELDSATEALETETQNLIRSAYNDYQAALRQEQSYQRLLDDERSEAYKANSDSVVYNSLKIELDNMKTLLDSLSLRKSETDVSSRLRGLEAVNAWVVDKADYPLSPASPNKRMNILIGLLAGLAGGIGVALGLEYLNHTIKTSKDVTSATGLPTLGSIPAFETEIRPKGPKGEIAKIKSTFWGKSDPAEAKPPRRRREKSLGLWQSGALQIDRDDPRSRNLRIELITSRDPQSIQAESFRSIRTTLLVSSPPGRIKTIILMSPLAREGKSSTISNLGTTLAEAAKRVVIVDSDLRRPRQARIFGASGSHAPGLSTYLSSHIEPGEVVRPTDIQNLHLISSGPLPANPIELLTSERMDGLVAYLKRNFDFVLFDTPPLLAVSDALAMGPMADAIILVARGRQTPIQAIKQAKQKLDAHKLRCLGVILNGIDIVEQDGYYARQYYRYTKLE